MNVLFGTEEISPLLPNSCRYVPTCSEYSMEAYKKYGVVKGTVLTAWRLCRCNPLGNSKLFDSKPTRTWFCFLASKEGRTLHCDLFLTGGSGFDPPRWFDEERPSPEE